MHMLVSGRGNAAVTVTFLKSKFSCSFASAVRSLFIKPEGNRRESPAVILTLLKLQGNGTSLQTEASGDVRAPGWGCPALSAMKGLVMPFMKFHSFQNARAGSPVVPGTEYPCMLILRRRKC